VLNHVGFVRVIAEGCFMATVLDRGTSGVVRSRLQGAT
jgi:hypothetical protein